MTAGPVIAGYRPRDLKICYFTTLREFGYRSAVTLTNALPSATLAADSVEISLDVFSHDGEFLGTTGPVAGIGPGASQRFEIEGLTEAMGLGVDDDVLGIFHLLPSALADRESMDVPIGDLFAYTGLCDEYVEYWSDAFQIGAGLAYQSPPMNDPRLGGTRSTLMQSPKVFLSGDLDTVLTVLNVSTWPEYDSTIEFHVAVLAHSGEIVARDLIPVPPGGFRRVSLCAVVERAGRMDDLAGGTGMVAGFSETGSVVPISMTRDRVSGGLALDHTLPPVYYLPWWGGAVRTAANQRLRSLLFDDGRHGGIEASRA